MKGILLVVEGMGGSGKSTVCDYIEDWLLDSRIDYARTREPGGTFAGEYLRPLCRKGIPNNPDQLHPMTVALLYNASRVENLTKVILPGLAEGKVVLCDRWCDSTYAYQGGYGGVPLAKLQELHETAVNGVQPDLTLLLDGDPGMFLSRISAEEKVEDQFDSLKMAEYERVRKAYHAAIGPNHRVINAGESKEQVAAQVLPFLLKLQNDLLQRPVTV